MPTEPRGGQGASELAGALRPAWVGVDLDALTANFRRLRERLAPGRILAVVKADAYGHGARHVALALEQAGVDRLGVALVEEGAELRRAGVEAPVILLGTARPSQLPLFRRYRLIPTLSGPDQLRMWREWSRGGSRVQPVHLKVDTGMSRLGFAPQDVAEALALIRAEPKLELRGFASHLADADLPESPRTEEQAARFAEVLELLSDEERRTLDIHLANSAASLHHPGCRYSMVRLGLALLGLDPLRQDQELMPVMSVSARIVELRRVPAGTRLSYGGRHTTTRESEIAVVPVGYADGYPWRLSNRASALLGGKRVPVAGNVTMDMTLLDVTGRGAAVGDEALLLGEAGKERVDAHEIADLAGTLPWEILCLMGLRLPRRYRRDGVWSDDLLTRFARGDR